MAECPKCQGAYFARRPGRHLDADKGSHRYSCRDCSYEETRVEVPEHYLRELVMNSIKLASLVKLPG